MAITDLVGLYAYNDPNPAHFANGATSAALPTIVGKYISLPFQTVPQPPSATSVFSPALAAFLAAGPFNPMNGHAFLLAAHATAPPAIQSTGAATAGHTTESDSDAEDENDDDEVDQADDDDDAES